MDNKKEKLSMSLEYDEAQTIPLALHEMHMSRADRRLFRANICWASALGAVLFVLLSTVLAFVWLWNQYDYSSSIEANGVYNLVDSQGNVLTSDISPDDVIRILEILNDGQSEDNKVP